MVNVPGVPVQYLVLIYGAGLALLLISLLQLGYAINLRVNRKRRWYTPLLPFIVLGAMGGAFIVYGSQQRPLSPAEQAVFDEENSIINMVEELFSGDRSKQSP